jgi:hypothetical protein
MSSNVFRRFLELVLEERAEAREATSAPIIQQGNHYILGEADPLVADARASAESGRRMRQVRGTVAAH